MAIRLYHETSREPIQASLAPTGTINAVYEFECHAKTYASAKAVAAAIDVVLATWTNVAGTPAVSSCRNTGQPQEDWNYLSDDSEDIEWVVTHEYSLWYA